MGVGIGGITGGRTGGVRGDGEGPQRRTARAQRPAVSQLSHDHPEHPHHRGSYVHGARKADSDGNLAFFSGKNRWLSLVLSVVGLQKNLRQPRVWEHSLGQGKDLDHPNDVMERQVGQQLVARGGEDRVELVAEGRHRAADHGRAGVLQRAPHVVVEEGLEGPDGGCHGVGEGADHFCEGVPDAEQAGGGVLDGGLDDALRGGGEGAEAEEGTKCPTMGVLLTVLVMKWVSNGASDAVFSLLLGVRGGSSSS